MTGLHTVSTQVSLAERHLKVVEWKLKNQIPLTVRRPRPRNSAFRTCDFLTLKIRRKRQEKANPESKHLKRRFLATCKCKYLKIYSSPQIPKEIRSIYKSFAKRRCKVHGTIQWKWELPKSVVGRQRYNLCWVLLAGIYVAILTMLRNWNIYTARQKRGTTIWRQLQCLQKQILRFTVDNIIPSFFGRKSRPRHSFYLQLVFLMMTTITVSSRYTLPVPASSDLALHAAHKALLPHPNITNL